MLLFHSQNQKFKYPFGAVPTGRMVKITFPIKEEIFPQGVFLIVRGKNATHRYRLELEGARGGYNYYKVEFSEENAGIYYYRFEIETGDGTLFVGSNGEGKAIIGDWLPEWQLTVYDASYKTPYWLKGGIIYHIFPDRFARVEDDKKPRFGYLKEWGQDVTIIDRDGIYRANDFFGGNIKGVLSKLDYLESLSVTAIYFSPIFEAASNHRYDTADYMNIDSLFGTQEEFENLCKECEKRGIAIILDGVFNHTGANSLYFNKFGYYPTLGAYQSKESPYYDWYTFTDFPEKYHCWWGVTVVPSVKRDAIGYQKLIAGENGVLDKWTKMGVKGWRLDVVDEISPSFVKKIRKKIKEQGDIALIGEVWEDASTKVSYSEEREYLLGKELDGVMNYPYRTAILDYIRYGGGKKFKNRIMQIAENYPRAALHNSMTLIGTHDTVRAINELAGISPPKTKEERLNFRLSKEQYQNAKQRLKLAVVLQYLLPGVPTVYYGDEIGMEGYEDPINRRPMPAQVDKELLSFYQKLGKIRKDNKQNLLSNIDIAVLSDRVKITLGSLVAIVNPHKSSFSLEHSVHDLLTSTELGEVTPCTAVVFNV